MTMNPLLFIGCLVFAFGSLGAQTNGWQPSPGHTQVSIWPGAAPDAQPLSRPETATTKENNESLVAEYLRSHK